MPARLTSTGQLEELLGIPFTPEQLDCITAPPAPQVIVAGAGSGKTTVMAARVVWLVGTGRVQPEQVLGLTFTNKAAGELSERVRKALVRAGFTDPDPDDPENARGEPQISTYHAFAGRLLTEHGLRLGIEPGSRLLADATRFQLAASVLRADPGPFEALTKSVAALVEDLLALDGELSEHLVPPGGLRAYDEELLAALDSVPLGNAALRKVPQAALGRSELLGLVEKYRARKRERDLLDFGDQIALAATLAREVPEVGRALRAQYSAVLLDEYQDTSVAQRVLLSGLFGAGQDGSGQDGSGQDGSGQDGNGQSAGRGEGAGHAVTAVGDPCQAIYGWRGASVANLDDFPLHFPHADGRPARRYSLSQNRRSGGRLLTLANTLAAPLRRRHEGVEALRPAPGAESDGLVRCALLPTHEEEVEWLADSLAHLVRTGTPPGEIAVLCRGAGDFAEIQGALVARELPVEVVGLTGLLHLPEVADLVAMCEVLSDPTANASLVRLLTGPRWRIGPRDLALLGRRARLLVEHGEDHGGDPDRRLAAAVEGVDPAEVVSLADALETFLDAGGPHEDGLPFSAEARVRFTRLAAEIRDLRRSLADPLMDVLHRVLAVSGLEVELSASPHALAARRRETLSSFLDVAAGFAAVDGEATLLAFLGFLRTAAQYEKGLDSSLPGGENAVKVLTAHKAKGLEWDVVAVPGLVSKQFPSEQARESWLSRPKVLPHALRGDAATLPDVAEWTAKGVKDYDTAMRDHQATEELRLGYVTFTRPRSLLLGSGHWWGPHQKRPRGPSAFLDALRSHCEADPAHGEVERWADAPAEDEENPALSAAAAEVRAWPLPLDETALARRRAAADAVLERLAEEEPAPEDAAGARAPAADADDATDAGPQAAAVGPGEATDGLSPEESRLVASWDRDLDALTGELRRSRVPVRDVPLPTALSASQMLRMAADPDGFARELARPMPRPPQPAAARRGTRFHAWVESRFEELTLPMLGPDELPGAGEEAVGSSGPGGSDDEPDGIADERDLAALKEAFQRSPYAHRTPYRVEEPFQLELAGRVVRGRIDAVYRDVAPDGTATYDIVDWKTGRARDADPLQLSVYRLAWAEKQRVPLESVGAAFLYVRGGEVVRPEGLLGRTGLEELLLGPDGAGTDGGRPPDAG
ncbi:ATP-dependent helicase [Streptomyces bathyalis]|uniref:DNA 3'-5' helicase n=1 Tax=Streptomyces bathyalis TaxID=2710756 RepID=A0A7T1WTC9_9ACTN|nr:ATP-dependent DNA helicase [Streptomyces bathyalis]QPP06700.1 ATP-dependent helicase [Streptomyces bathyalis]